MRSFIMGCAALVLVGAGCGAAVTSTVTPGSNLGQYKTYTFLTPHYRQGRPESPAEQEARASLAQGLADKGLMLAQPGQKPDFEVAYNVKEQQKWDVEDLGYYWGPGNVYSYTQGTLIVDFVDPATNKVFWRGTATDVVDNPSSPDLGKVDAAVTKMVKQYPGSALASTARPAM
jgi:hypothetical protein